MDHVGLSGVKPILLFATTAAVAAPVFALGARHITAPSAPQSQVASSCGRRCGVERWQIKTLSDPESDRVNRAPITTTIEELVELPRPRRTPQNSRIAPTELTTYQVDAYLGGYRPEDDGDVHLYLFGMQNQRASMIAEIPDPNCTGACASGLGAEFAKARATLVQILAEPNAADTPILVRVTGVGFFDRNHGQVAAAPNLIELHPVLALERLSEPANGDSSVRVGLRRRRAPKKRRDRSAPD